MSSGSKLRITILFLVFTLILPSLGAASALDPVRGIQGAGALKSGPVGSTGGVDLSIERTVYTPKAGSLTAQEGSLFLLVQMTIKGLHHEAFVPKEKLSFRLENGYQTIPGWEMDWRLTEAFAPGDVNGWAKTVKAGDLVTLYAGFVIPANSKDVWCHLQSKVGAAPEKGTSGGMRFKLGDLPQDEDVAERPQEHVVVVGSYWSKYYALRFASRVRESGLNAWVMQAGKPEGMYAVSVWRAMELHSALSFVQVARDHGYENAYVLPPWRPR